MARKENVELGFPPASPISMFLASSCIWCIASLVAKLRPIPVRAKMNSSWMASFVEKLPVTIRDVNGCVIMLSKKLNSVLLPESSDKVLFRMLMVLSSLLAVVV